MFNSGFTRHKNRLQIYLIFLVSQPIFLLNIVKINTRFSDILRYIFR
jgi:hypothetical protein